MNYVGGKRARCEGTGISGNLAWDKRGEAGRGRSHVTTLWIFTFVMRAMESHRDILNKMTMKSSMGIQRILFSTNYCRK